LKLSVFSRKAFYFTTFAYKQKNILWEEVIKKQRRERSLKDLLESQDPQATKRQRVTTLRQRKHKINSETEEHFLHKGMRQTREV
jgi:hypothetical protein